MASANTASAPSPQNVSSSAVPFKITTQPDGYLPDMTGFELERLGSLKGGWHTLCPIRAGRDLVEGEVISACLVRERDGELQWFDYTAVAGALKADQWPQAFASFIAAQGKGISAGGWNADGGLTCEGTVDLRLWCRNLYRAFSTAPFANNLVQALACDDDYVLASGQSLCLQVRDLNTQHLYEHHVFTPTSNQAGKAWSKALCEQLNRDSRLVRAGVLDTATCAITPAAEGNAFWVAQCAGLSVTLNEVNWWASQEVQGGEALSAGQAVQVWVYDAYSHKLMDSFSWEPTEAQCAAGKWLEDWAKALNTSSVGQWLCASVAAPRPAASGVAKAKQLTLWQRGEGLRVFTSLPASDNWVAGPRLDSAWGTANDAVLVTVRHPYSKQLLGHTVVVAKDLADQVAWEAALGQAIGKQPWPELRVGREGDDGKLESGESRQGAYGETLDLSWQRKAGQFLLRQVKSGDVELFNASYTAAQVEMNVWPTSDLEKSRVTLILNDHLLRTFTRTQGDKTALNPLQQVDCDYEDDPTLDRVLYRLRELDGSVERVNYEAKAVTFKDGRPALPRVTCHLLIPGGGAENVVTDFSYAGSYVEGGASYDVVSHSQKIREFKQYGKNGEMLVGIRSVGGCIEINGQCGNESNGELVSCTMSLGAAHEILSSESKYYQSNTDREQAQEWKRARAQDWARVVRAKVWDDAWDDAWAEARARAEDEAMTCAKAKAWAWAWGRTRTETDAEAEFKAWAKAGAEAEFKAWAKAGAEAKPFYEAFLTEAALVTLMKERFDQNHIARDIKLLVAVLAVECCLQRLDACEESKLLTVLNGWDVAKRVSVEKMQFAVATYQLLRAVGRILCVADNPSWGKGGDHAYVEFLRGGQFMDANLAKGLLPLTHNDAAPGCFNVLKQQIEYSADHTVQKLTTADNIAIYRCYYPATASGTNPLTPSALVSGFTDFPALSCPAVPEGATPPLMAEYQCDAQGNPLGLTLYGYRSVTRNARQLLEATSIVTLEGIKATLTGDRLDATVVWALANPDEQILWRVRSTSSSEPGPKTPNEGKVLVWSITDEQSTVLGDQRVKMTTVQAFEDNPTAAGLQVTTRASTVAGTQEVSRETRSRFSRRCLSKTVDGVQTEFEHDGLGRVIKQQRYRFKANGETVPESVVTTSYAIEQGSLCALTTSHNGSQQRDWLDGLQRVVRSEWRRSANAPFIPFSRKDLRGTGDDDEVVDQQWDYLPGGLALCEPLQPVEMPGRQVWSRDLLDTAGTVEQGLGHQTLLRSTSTLETLANGHLKRRETLCSTTGVARADVVREFDANGRLIELTQTVDGTARKQLLTRDGLGRVIRETRADGSVVQRSYHGMSTHVTELKVFKDGKAATAGQVVATQSVNNISTLNIRKVGTREYKFQGDNVTLPDGSPLTLAEKDSGGDYQAGDLTLSSVSRIGSVTTLSSGSGAAQGSDLKVGRWQHSLTASQLPGKQQLDETTPRRTSSGCIWQSLRGLTVATLRADGHWQRVFSDHQGRLLRSWHDHEDVLYRHDEHGRLVERRVHGNRSGAQWQVASEHDVFGQESLRTFSHNGQAVFAQQLEWRGDGQLLAKHSQVAGKRVRSERFAYDALNRLVDYTCDVEDSKHCPCDEQGKPVKAQRFTWDALSNLQACVTTYSDGKTRSQAFAYDGSNPTRLKTVTTDKQAVEVKHNGNGYLTEDGKTRKLTYNAGGQLTQVSDATVQTSYAYDGYQRLAAQYVGGDKSTCELRYAGDTLIGEDWFAADGTLSRQRSINPGLAEYEDNDVNWLIDDPQCGVAGYYKNATLQLTPLLPFGEGKVTTAISSGYNGMRRDPVTGSYHAGNGYRCYDPNLYRHTQPDWLSPFGEGGINDYGHCPDPVNLHDPSGAIMISRWGQSQMLASLQQSLRDTQPFPVGSRWRGIAFSAAMTVIGIGASILTGGTASMLVFAALTALSVASLGLEVASVVVEDSNPELAKKLSIASAVTGLLSIGNFTGVFKQSARFLKSAASFAVRVVKSAPQALRAGLNIAWNIKRYGFAVARQMFISSRKAVKLAQEAAEATAQAVKTEVFDGLGELATRQFTVVEKDLLLKVASGNKFHVITGWSANFYSRATQQQPRMVKLVAEAAEWADNVMDYSEVVSVFVDAEDEQGGGRDRISSVVRLL